MTAVGSKLDAVAFYPLPSPYREEMLEVGDGQSIHFQMVGSPQGKPAVVLHGGPGQGSSLNMARAFHPERYRVLLFDQRGCGQSRPHASSPDTSMTHNTTQALVADMEALREHLDVSEWLICGGSWGATLALAYAEQYPAHVSELVLTNITTSRRTETAWLYEGLSAIFPREWEAFRDHLTLAERKTGIIAGYSARLRDPDLQIRARAAQAWGAWEDAVLSREPQPATARWGDIPIADLIAMTRICAHYGEHGAFLEEGALIKEAGRLAGIRGTLIHGVHDLTCPIESAQMLARAWPGCELVTIPDAGHLGSPLKRQALLDALAGYEPRCE